MYEKRERKPMADVFTLRVIAVMRRIPVGRVTTYGLIAAAAGNRRGARQVARILHACSTRHGLPWHRVVNRNGEIAMRASVDCHIQRGLLAEEGVFAGADDRIDFAEFLWWPEEEAGDF
jgi:methylated-DNA-protein-cysteine methyltransferase-like protein